MKRSDALHLCASLGIGPERITKRQLSFYAEARQLTPVGLGTDGRDKLLTAHAARGWLAMREAANHVGIRLQLISAFRSWAFQAALIAAKLERGVTMETVLAVNAPPGFSEHHTGRAVDIGSAGCAALDEVFEQTAAFAWLTAKAADFGFVMSYPRGNAEGFLYEPWHWCYRPR